MATVEIDFSLDPAERVKLEMEANNDSFAHALGNYILEQFSFDSELKKAYFERKITLNQVIEYVNKCAETKLNGKSGAIQDVEVFGWVIHFIQDEKVKIVKNESYTITKQDEEEAKKKAIEEYKKAEIKRLENERQAKERAQEIKLEKALAKEKAEREALGQMSLFDNL